MYIFRQPSSFRFVAFGFSRLVSCWFRCVSFWFHFVVIAFWFRSVKLPRGRGGGVALHFGFVALPCDWIGFVSLWIGFIASIWFVLRFGFVAFRFVLHSLPCVWSSVRYVAIRFGVRFVSDSFSSLPVGYEMIRAASSQIEPTYNNFYIAHCHMLILQGRAVQSSIKLTQG